MAVGIDSLTLTYEVMIAEATFVELDELRELSRRRREENIADAVMLTLGPQKFIVLQGAQAPFRHLIDAPNVMAISIAKRNHVGTPTIRVEVRSAFLWTHGYVDAVGYVREIVDELSRVDAETGEVSTGARDVIERISRLDLTVDFQGWRPEGTDAELERMSCRALAFTRHGRPGAGFSGYSIGRGDILVRLYNKTEEIRKSQKYWFKVVWHRRGFDVALPVWRLEVQLRSEALGRLDARVDFDHVRQRLDAVWSYIVGAPGKRRGWLSLREAVPDVNKSRWPIADAWRVLQSVEFVAAAEPALPAEKAKADVEHLRRQISGNLSSLVAISPPKGFEDSDAALMGSGLDEYRRLQKRHDRRSSTTFGDRVREKTRVRRASVDGQRARRLAPVDKNVKEKP